MRVKVRAIEPRADDAELEELRAEPPVARPPTVTAASLGPNGDDVLDLLGRASRLTAAESQSLDKEAAWRWWLVNPLVGSGLIGARAAAVARARAAGRSDALVALQTAVATLPLGPGGSRAGRARLRACISNAGLAILVRDLVEPEAFTTLIGPWREVMRD